MKRTPLKRATQKYAKELRAYSSLKKFYLMRHPYCEYPSTNGTPSCMDRAVEIHHIKGRGKYLNDPQYFLPICQYHHRYLHDHGREARAKGLIQ